ncbi:hypothetical protein [Candidatus Uabimicrobium sp. HlEnr_7]|uniref:DUF6939 family protein n=1 Tax=Candidatus Uabimicrobium helgolandensis TaxID=3095367 RepID=UPI003556CA45
MKKVKYAKCHFVAFSKRDHVSKDALLIDVSSYSEEPYCQFSPFYVHNDIPIPKKPGEYSDTVEGIWQGLKVIRKKIAPRYFRGPGKKRGGKPEGHKYGGKLLSIVEARYKIYKISYDWVLENKIEQVIYRDILDNAKKGIPQYFHDMENNGDINNPSSPLAHASLLVQYINILIKKELRKEC